MLYLLFYFRQKDRSNSKHKRKKHKNKLDADIEKSSKKSSKKKKKKKEKKRRKTASSGSETCSDAEDTVRRKQRRKGGKSKRRKKEHKDRTEDSDTEDSRSDTRTRTHRKRVCPETDTLTKPQKKKRKNWKAANEERSEESSDAWLFNITCLLDYANSRRISSVCAYHSYFGDSDHGSGVINLIFIPNQTDTWWPFSPCLHPGELV